MFAPNPLPVDPELYRWYAAEIQRDAVRFGLTLPAEPIEDNDSFDDKIQLLLDDPVPLVSFTFGIPSHRVISALKTAGTIVVQTVTNPAEAIAALVDPARTETVLTRAFTGRPARGLRNAFIDAHEADAPWGYPAIHHLTSPLRKAAAAAGQPDFVHLWAGTGYRQATEEPTADILQRLAGGL